ncbi:MAG: redoxin domain-containing protein, partial [Patescibacteria group bacterium]|nr:redoxin domain-containing protein [Patescibacteria group bacterium]
VELYEVKALFADGMLHAASERLPGQVVARKTPSELSLGSLNRTQVLAPALGPAFAEHLTRLVLLLDSEGLSHLLDGAEEPELAEAGEIEGRPCHRVRIRREGQVATLWIDQQSFVLRRIVLPADGAVAGIPGEIRSASLVAEFTAAQLNAAIPPEAFQFEVPEGAEVVKFFQLPHPADLLGKQANEFQFAGTAGDTVDRQSLAGKVAVLDFWALDCEPCRASLPALDVVRRQYAGNPNVVFLAVNVDPPDTADAALAPLFTELDVQMPIVRDRQQHAFSTFRIPGVPTLFVLDGKGVVQYYAIGANPRVKEELPKVIETLLAGSNTFESQQKQYQEQLRQTEEILDRAETSSAESMEAEPLFPEARITPRSEPRNMRLAQLWTNTELKSPGNLLAFRRADGQPAIAVVDAWKRIAELSLDGKLLAAHEPAIEPAELFNALRSATDVEGKRYFAAVALMSGQQRFHLLDGQFRLLLSFPSDAVKNPHSGIADVQLADLAGNGVLRAYVGYWGEVGVQEVSLTGERTWGNRNVPNVQKMAVAAPNANGARRVLCANVTSTLAVLDADGTMATPLSLGDRLVGWIASADLEGDGPMAYCALAAETLGENEAIGLTIDGNHARIAWTYRLPDGISRQPVEPITFGRLTAEGPGQWILPGPDGSVHILSVDGKLLDSFH